VKEEKKWKGEYNEGDKEEEEKGGRMGGREERCAVVNGANLRDEHLVLSYKITMKESGTEEKGDTEIG